VYLRQIQDCPNKGENFMELKQILNGSARWSRLFVAVVAIALAASVSLAGLPQVLRAQNSNSFQNPSVVLPLIHCWYKGKVAYYIQTEASDEALAQQQNVNYVPRLSNAIAAGAVDDIYHVTNFNQGNVIPSAPIPAGPTNTDPNYTPIWQLSLVTWKSGTAPHVLKSEEEVLNAQSQNLLDIVKTNIVINCPVIYTPAGGLLPTAKIIGDYENQSNR
jgi:hypothetical protein